MERLLTLQEILELTGVSYQTILRWRNAGIFPESHTEKGKKLLWTQSSIRDWLDKKSEPVNTPMVTAPRKQRHEEKSFSDRQEAARAALERHRKAK